MKYHTMDPEGLDADAFDVSVSDDGGTILFGSGANPLGTNGDGSPELFLADATLFLELFGVIAVAWQWLRQAGDRSPVWNRAVIVVGVIAMFVMYGLPLIFGGDDDGGGTGAAPLLFRDHISVPTIPALARARHHLDRRGVGRDVTLIITGGLRVPSDFIKALALGADGIALANSAMQAIGCIGARICNSNNCPAGIATQKPELRARLDIERSAAQLNNFLCASVDLMKVMARACGHAHLKQFNLDDLATLEWSMARQSGIPFSGLDGGRN